MKKIVLLIALFIVLEIFVQGNAEAERDIDIVTVIVEQTNAKNMNSENHYMLGNFYKIKVQKKDLKYLGKRLWIEREYKLLLDTAVPVVNVTDLWNSSYNGSGIKICILDTGINKTHPAFGSRVIAEKDFVTDDSDGNNPADFHGHGTHVAGIAASENETYKGIAYGASLLNAKVFSSTTTIATDSNIMSGIDWCIQQGADILSMSFGGAGTSDDMLSAYVDLAVDAGKIVVIAAGNSGPFGDSECRTSGDGSLQSVCSPGLAHKVITVGSTKKDDVISSFSSRGPTEDGRIKPDVTAHGQSITSVNFHDGWISMSGTSMATPMVAGLAAVILQAKKNITPEELKALMMNTAKDLGDSGKDNIYGAGRISGLVLDEINNTKKETVYLNGNVYFLDITNKPIKATLYWPENYSIHNNLDFYLLDPYGKIIINSSSINNTDEILIFGKEQIDAHGVSNNFSGKWKLLVKPQNATSEQTYAIASNNPFGRQLFAKFGSIGQKLSYHTINVTNSSLSVNLDFDYTKTDLDIRVFNMDSDIEGFSLTNSSENITLANVAPGLWTVQIRNKVNGSNYFLSSESLISENFSDEYPPNITITSPVSRTYKNQTVNLTFSAVDDVSKNVTCNVTLDNISLISGTETYFSKIIGIIQGHNTIYISCADDDNNTAIKNVSFTVDSAVKIMLSSPTPNNELFYFSNTVTINVSSENLDTLILQWDGLNETITGNLSTRIIIKDNLEDGNYTFKLFANDTSGNINISETRWVFINATRNKTEIFNNLGVNFELLNSTNGNVNTRKLFSFEKYKLKFNLTNLSITIFNFLIDDLNGTINKTQNVSLPFKSIIGDYVWLDFSLIAEGKYSANIDFSNPHKLFFYLNGSKDNFTYIHVTDTCNLNITNTPCINSSTMFLPSFSGAAAVTDAQAPELIMNLPTATTYTSASVGLSYNAGDNIALGTCWYNLNGVNTTLQNCWNATITAANGSNVVTLYANDSSGNVNQTFVSFTVSLPTPAPAPSVPSFSSNSGGGGGTSSPTVAAQPAPSTVKQNATQNRSFEPPSSEKENEFEEVEDNDLVEKVAEPNIPITGLVTESNTDYTFGLAVFVIIVLGGIGFYTYRKKF